MNDDRVEGEIGRLQVNSTDFILFSLKEYKGKNYIDLRKYVVSDSFTGFTKQGVRFAAEQFNEFEEKVKLLKAALSEIEAKP
ncbi:MAG: transcriptional coactivator p15/PC4 family protein [Thermodesulfobacteriota bacterium]